MQKLSGQLLPALAVTCISTALAAPTREPDVQPPERPHRHEAFETRVHTGWESRYFSEGRDTLDGGSLWASSIELGWQHVIGGILYEFSPDQRYDEMQFMLALGQRVGDLEFYAACTHLHFPTAGDSDDEIGTGLIWAGLPLGLELAADIYYSFDADGLFSELALRREVDITEVIRLGATGMLGINEGYIPDGHDGANHLALRLDAEIAVSDSVSMTAQTTYSRALQREPGLPGDALLRDFFYAGIGLEWTF